MNKEEMNKEEIYKYWKEECQPFELSYHQHGNPRWDGHGKRDSNGQTREDIWEEQWDNIFGFLGLSPNYFNSDSILFDVGCGSRPVLDFFNSGKKFFLDPLLDEYLNIDQMKKYWAKYPPENLFSLAGEDKVESMVNKCDFVLSWNAIDHSYDSIKIIENIHAYTSPEGIAYIGTDLHEKSHTGHPGIGSKALTMERINELFEIKKSASMNRDIRQKIGAEPHFKRCREVALVLKKRK